MWVYEDDTTADELVWTSSFDVSPAEASAGSVDRTFQCGGALGSDAGSEWEVYAEVEVDKDACGTFCFPDHPTTSNLFVQQVADDAAEDDDTSSQAASVSPGLTTDRISNDAADWLAFDVTNASQMDCTVVHDPGSGRLEATLLDASFATVAVFDWIADATVASETLPSGTYFVVVAPDDAADPNFYDLALELSPVPAVPALPLFLRVVLSLALVASAAIRLPVGSFAATDARARNR
jgi:hypothetical protein